MMGFLLDTNILSELRKARKGSDHSLVWTHHCFRGDCW